jgi:hypothetical protein
MAKSKVKEKEEVKYELTALDRCDRCEAQAYVRVSGVSGELLFCGHHYKKVEDSIKEWAFKIIDERDKLVENRLTGSEN